MRLYDRGGILVADAPVTAFTESKAGASSASLLCALPLDSHDGTGNQVTSRLVVAGHMAEIQLIDSSRLWMCGGPGGGVFRGSSAVGSAGRAGSVIRTIASLPVQHAVGAMAVAEGRSLIAASLDSPAVTVYDILMRSPAPTARLTGHSGGTLSLDATHNTLVTVGCSAPGDSPLYPGPRPSSAMGRASVATLDALVKVFDLRMGRVLTQITVPGSGRGGGPVYVKYMPAQGSTGADTLLVATADGRVFTSTPGSDRILKPLGSVDGVQAAMARANMKGETFVPTPEHTRLRVSAVALAPFGQAAALSDHNGMVHLLSANQNVPTSVLGYPLLPAAACAGPEPWLSGAEKAWDPIPIDATTTDPEQLALQQQLAVQMGGSSSSLRTQDKMVSSFAAAVAQRAQAAGVARFSAQAGSNSTMPGTEVAQGNALSASEATSDALFDAVLLAGTGSDVPVAAPGVGSLISHEGHKPWDGLWSLALDTVEQPGKLAKLGIWSDGKAASGGGSGRPSAHKASSPTRSQQRHTAPFFAPGKDRASVFPDGYLDSPMVSLLRRSLREVDPVLLSLADKTGSYVSNRSPSLRLRPNALIYGARRGFINLDPRQKLPGKSSLGLGGRGRIGRGRADSIDSASTGSSMSLDRVMRGDDFDEDIDDEHMDEEEGEDDAASVDTMASFLKSSDWLRKSSHGAPQVQPLLRKGKLRVPRVYRRPKLTATRYGFFDTDYSKFSRFVSSSMTGVGIHPGGAHAMAQSLEATPYAYMGLEDIGPNSFVNAPIQMLFFARALRRRLHAHLCVHPHCTACELRFLFDAMVQGPAVSADARVIPAHNLTRVLLHGEARKLGLLHPCSLEPARRMELYVRMALDRLGKELAGQWEPELPLPATYTAYADGTFFSQGTLDADRVQGSGGRPKPQAARKTSAAKAKGTSADASTQGSIAGTTMDRGAAPDSLFGISLISTTTCASGHSESRASDVLVLDMHYAAVGDGLASAAPGATGTNTTPGSAFTQSLVSEGNAVGSAYCTSNQLPTVAVPPPEYSFVSILRASLMSAKRQKAWCDGCKDYVQQRLVKSATAIGPLLCVSANLGSDRWVRELWRTVREDGRPWLASAVDIGFAAATGSSGSNTYVKDASACGGGALAVGSPSSPPAGTARYHLVGMLLHLPPATMLRASSDQSAVTGAQSTAASAVSDSAAVSHFHYVAVLKITPHDGSFSAADGDSESGAGRSAGSSTNAASGQWMVFNNFRITPTTEEEALDMRPAWKRPVVLLYQRADHESGPSPSAERFHAHVQTLLGGLRQSGQAAEEATAVHLAVQARAAAGFLFPACLSRAQAVSAGVGDSLGVPSPGARMACDAVRIPPAVFALPPSIPHQPALGPAPSAPSLPADAVPRSGELLALDAEFVSVSTERSLIRSDGSRQPIAAARLMPGRLSIVRDTRGLPGYAPLGPAAAARPVVLDAYIVAAEPVVDHLTRFSGIQPGDLDLDSSSHRLHTYKSVYLRLRAVMDAGAVIVGHGLRKDFRELGAVLPSSQSVDTVQLWKTREQGSRYLSLKFLASHVLGADIQGTVHDSNEDAECALALYRAYVELEAEGGRQAIDRLLQALYEVGRATGWKAHAADGQRVPTHLLPASLRSRFQVAQPPVLPAVFASTATEGVADAAQHESASFRHAGHEQARRLQHGQPSPPQMSALPVSSMQDARAMSMPPRVVNPRSLPPPVPQVDTRALSIPGGPRVSSGGSTSFDQAYALSGGTERSIAAQPSHRPLAAAYGMPEWRQRPAAAAAAQPRVGGGLHHSEQVPTMPMPMQTAKMAYVPSSPESAFDQATPLAQPSQYPPPTAADKSAPFHAFAHSGQGLAGSAAPNYVVAHKSAGHYPPMRAPAVTSTVHTEGAAGSNLYASATSVPTHSVPPPYIPSSLVGSARAVTGPALVAGDGLAGGFDRLSLRRNGAAGPAGAGPSLAVQRPVFAAASQASHAEPQPPAATSGNVPRTVTYGGYVPSGAGR